MHVLITPRADRSGRGLSRTAVHQQGRQEPFGQVPDCGISAEIIPVLMRNIPSPALSLSLSPEKQAWGNPCLTPRPLTAPGWERPYPGRAHGGLPHLVPCTCPQLQGKGREDRVWDSRHGGPAPARSGPLRAASDPPRREQRTNKFALCLGQSRQLLESMSDRISAVADSLSLHIFMSVKKREARGS